jgi:phosphoenolpyruvate-protein kinase (PTS system EI component)
MTDRLQTESCESQKQIVNLNYLDREAVIYKQSKNDLIEYSKQVKDVVEQNTTQEVQEVEEAIKRLNEKVEKIMETKYVKERQEKIEAAQQQMMNSIKEASNTFFQVRGVIRSKDNLSPEEKLQYEEKLFHKILDKFMTKEEKELFTRIIMAGPMFMIGGRGSMPLSLA